MNRTRNYTIVVAVAGLLVGAPPAVAHPTARDAKRWARVWCKVQPGWSRAHVRKVMGKPTVRLPDQDQWDGFGYHFTAFLDETGRVRQLDINESMLSAAQRRRVRCDTART